MCQVSSNDWDLSAVKCGPASWRMAWAAPIPYTGMVIVGFQVGFTWVWESWVEDHRSAGFAELETMACLCIEAEIRAFLLTITLLDGVRAKCLCRLLFGAASTSMHVESTLHIESNWFNRLFHAIPLSVYYLILRKGSPSETVFFRMCRVNTGSGIA